MQVLLIYETPVLKHLYLNQIQPLGILYIASYLESKGITTEVLDLNVDNNKKINFKKFDYIGFSVNAGNIENTIESVKKVKQKSPKSKIILGGPHIKIVHKKLLELPQIECLIADEAEDIMYKYIISKNKFKVKGIYIRKKGKSFFTGKRKPIQDLDSLPYPAIDKIPYKKYDMVIKKESPTCAINTSRGCPYSCVFCYHSLGHKYRARKPENVVKEIKWLKNKGINELYITDDNFTQNMKRVEEICDLIIRQKINISLSLANGIRADKINKKLLRKLKSAGVWNITFAPEVGSEKSMKKIRKGFTKKQVIKAVEMSKRLGLFTMSNFVIGFPWETKKDIEDTIKFAKELDTDLMNVNRLIPYPGTLIWEQTLKGQYSLYDEKKDFSDIRFKHKTLTEDQIQRYIKKMNRTFYTPKKVISIMHKLGIKTVFNLAKYTIYSKLI